MSIFKNDNEANYVGGRKHWTDVIKNSGQGGLLLWRQPEEDFNTNSTLIVMPGEVALFVDNGKIVEVFENGNYKLSTQNYPFISRLKNAFSGGVSTFNCVVYFVRKSDSIELLWGTDSPIQVRDKVHDIRTDAKVRGSYKIQVNNPKLFLEKLVGNNVNLQTQEDVKSYFYIELQSKIKTLVSQFLNNVEQELIGLDSQLTNISDSLLPTVDSCFNDYGITCVSFAISGLDIDTTKYDRLDEYQIELTGKKKEALGDLEVMQILGNNWEKQQQVNIQKELAKNPGAGGVASAGAGLGMAMAAADAFNAMSKSNTNTSVRSKVDRLNELKELLELGCITQEDFDKRKQEILNEI